MLQSQSFRNYKIRCIDEFDFEKVKGQNGNIMHPFKNFYGSVLPQFYRSIRMLKTGEQFVIEFGDFGFLEITEFGDNTGPVQLLSEHFEVSDNYYYLSFVKSLDVISDSKYFSCFNRFEEEDRAYILNDRFCFMTSSNQSGQQSGLLDNPILLSAIGLSLFLKSSESKLNHLISQFDRDPDKFEKTDFQNLRKDVSALNSYLMYPPRLFSGRLQDFAVVIHESCNLEYRSVLVQKLVNELNERLSLLEQHRTAVFSKISAVTLIPLALASLLQINVKSFFAIDSISDTESIFNRWPSLLNICGFFCVLTFGAIATRFIYLYSQENRRRWYLVSSLTLSIGASVLVAAANISLKVIPFKNSGLFYDVAFFAYLIAGLVLIISGIGGQLLSDEELKSVSFLKQSYRKFLISAFFKSLHIFFWMAAVSKIHVFHVFIAENMFFVFFAFKSKFNQNRWFSKYISGFAFLASGLSLFLIVLNQGQSKFVSVCYGFLAAVSYYFFNNSWSGIKELEENSFWGRNFLTGGLLVLAGLFLFPINAIFRSIFDTALIPGGSFTSNDFSIVFIVGSVIALTYILFTDANIRARRNPQYANIGKALALATCACLILFGENLFFGEFNSGAELISLLSFLFGLFFYQDRLA